VDMGAARDWQDNLRVTLPRTRFIMGFCMCLAEAELSIFPVSSSCPQGAHRGMDGRKRSQNSAFSAVANRLIFRQHRRPHTHLAVLLSCG